MGHLTDIFNMILELSSGTCLGQFLSDNAPELHTSLEDFKENTLKDVNKNREILLVSLCIRTVHKFLFKYYYCVF